MVLIDENKVRKKIPVLVRSGKNRGYTAGHIIYEDGKESYYFVRKNFRKIQMWQKPIFMELVSISVDIVEKDLLPRDVKNACFQFIGFESRSFNVIIPIKDFLKGKIVRYDDDQYTVSWKGYPRIYASQKELVGWG